jgi:hypothetical protein
MTLYFCPNELISTQTRHPLAPGKVIKCTDQSVWSRQGCRMVAGYEHMDAMSKNHKISFPDGTGIAIGAQSPYKCDGALLTLRALAFGSGGPTIRSTGRADHSLRRYAVIEVHNNMPIKQDASGFRLEYSPGTPPKQVAPRREAVARHCAVPTLDWCATPFRSHKTDCHARMRANSSLR